jgi:hypothetical protein
MKETHMGHRGYHQGDMSPTVKDYQKPTHNFAEHQFGKTLEYIERHDRFEGKEAKGIEKQGYVGRYS